MWPRTVEEKNRRRNTGFVCFMNRDDSEEAMEACDNTDPFNNGRLLTVRWGKSVKKVQRRNDSDAGGLGGKTSSDPKTREGKKRSEKAPDEAPKDSPVPPLPETNGSDERLTTSDGFGKQQDSEKKLTPLTVPRYDPEIHASKAIRVEIPSDQARFHFISTTASYIAKDPELEQRLRDEGKGESLFSFLTTFGNESESGNDRVQKEKLFYRWRVYSFCQGDTYSIWRTEPFLMFRNGRYWIPPPLDADAVNREKADAAEKEHRQKQQKEDRANRELMTGRQFERRKRRGDFGANHSQLNPDELCRFDRLVRKQLSISRKTICEAMSFCFDNCMAAKQVSELLKEALLDDSDDHCLTTTTNNNNDARIARLYLLSDILFNSQQPGVRNAFMYRTTIESMAVEVFKRLGTIVRTKERNSGRITVHKLRKAVSAVLGAWTEWGVYNATFVDDLEAHFEGREVKRESEEARNNDRDNNAVGEKSDDQETDEDAEEVVNHGPLGDWKAVSNEEKPSDDKKKKRKKKTQRMAMDAAGAKPSLPPAEDSMHNHDSKSEPKDATMESRREGSEVDGTASGKDLEDDDLDGEDLDGEELDEDDLDGEELDGEDLDGEDLDGEDLDGEDLDGEEIDGESFERT